MLCQGNQRITANRQSSADHRYADGIHNGTDHFGIVKQLDIIIQRQHIGCKLAHQLPRHVAALGEARAVDDVVQTLLEQDQQVLTGLTGAALGLVTEPVVLGVGEVLVRLPKHRKVVKLQAIRSWTSLGGVGYCFDDAGVRVSGRDEGIGWLGELE